MASTGVVYISVEGERVPAWTCGCGEQRHGAKAVVKFNEPRRGVQYMVVHVACIEAAA